MIATELDQIAPALVAALGALSDPVKDGKVAAGQRRYTYLTLPHLLAEARKVLAGHGLCVMQFVELLPEGVGVTTTVLHTSGQYVTGPALVGALASRDPQSVGSAITYMRRYSLASMLGLAGSDDDDGAKTRPAATPPEPVRVKAPAATWAQVSQAQLAKMNAQLGELGELRGLGSFGRDERRDFVRDLLGLEVLESALDLSKEQGHRAIEELDRLIGGLLAPGNPDHPEATPPGEEQ